MTTNKMLERDIKRWTNYGKTRIRMQQKLTYECQTCQYVYAYMDKNGITCVV